MNENILRVLITAQMTIALMRATYTRGHRCTAVEPRNDVVADAVSSTCQYIGDLLSEIGNYRDESLYNSYPIITAAWEQAQQLEVTFRAS